MLDVRPTTEYAAAHIPGVVSICVSQLAGQEHLLLPGAPVIHGPIVNARTHNGVPIGVGRRDL